MGSSRPYGDRQGDRPTGDAGPRRSGHWPREAARVPSACAHPPPLPLAATPDWDFTSCPIRRGTWGLLKCGLSGGVKAEGGPAAAGGWAALSGRSRRRDAHGPLAGDAGNRPPRSCALGSGRGWRLRLLVPLPPRVYFGLNDLANNGFGISECRELSLRHSESRDERQPGFVCLFFRSLSICTRS